jgi:hypothetical protein
LILFNSVFPNVVPEFNPKQRYNKELVHLYLFQRLKRPRFAKWNLSVFGKYWKAKFGSTSYDEVRVNDSMAKSKIQNPKKRLDWVHFIFSPNRSTDESVGWKAV